MMLFKNKNQMVKDSGKFRREDLVFKNRINKTSINEVEDSIGSLLSANY